MNAFPSLAPPSRLLALAAAALMLVACAEAPEPQPDPARAVRVAAPEAAPAAPPVEVVGRLALRDEQQLAFRVPGIVAEVSGRAGEKVGAQQVLARLDTTEVDAAVEEAKAAAEKARRDYQRGKRLHADQVITQTELDDLATALEVARSRLARARFNQRHAVIRAPADGVVLRRMVEFVGHRPAVVDDALACAFRLAENPHIHRQAERGGHLASISDAYANATHVCQMWALFRRKAAKAGYAPFGGVRC